MSVHTHAAETRPGSAPANMLQVQVVRREVLMEGVVRLSLATPGTIKAPAPYLPGQFITLALPTQRQTLYRSYSLCGNGQLSQPWVITIKRQQRGVVSTYLCDHLREGIILSASRPRGSFVLPVSLQPGMPLILVAAGSGITPIMGMLSALALLPAEPRPYVQVHYASRSPSETIFLGELEALDPQSTWLHRWYYFSAHGVRLTPQSVVEQARLVGLRAHWYICGPTALKRDLQRLLEAYAVPEHHIHTEVFVASAAQPSTGSNLRHYQGAAPGADARLCVADTGAVLQVRPDETLLMALERHGYRPEFSCRAGACGTCRLKLLSGWVEPTGEALTPAERRAGYVLGCVAMPAGDITIASGGPAPVRGRASSFVAGQALSRRQSAIRRVRVFTLAGVIALVLASWHVTTHKPASSQNTSLSPSSNQLPGGTQPGAPSGSSSSGSSSSPSAPSMPTPHTQSGTS